MQPTNTLTQQTNFASLHFDGIQVLRGLAALLIICEHIRFLNCGAFGVDIFFIISGFMIMFTTQKNTKYFLRKRLIRILPFYDLMTILTFLLLLLFPSMFRESGADISQLIKSLLFIPFDIGDSVYQPILRIGWTINCEMFFYVLFAVCSKLSHKYRGLLTGLLILFVFVLNTVLDAFGYTNPFLQFYGAAVMLDFILGILCFYTVKAIFCKTKVCKSEICSAKNSESKVSETKQKRPMGANRPAGDLALSMLMLSFVLIVILMLTKQTTNILGFRRFFYWGIPSFFIVFSFCLAGLCFPMPKPLVQLGNISFSVYLLHYYPILFIDRKLCDLGSFGLRPTLFALAGTALILAASYLAWYLIEVRFSAFLKKHLLPR